MTEHIHGDAGRVEGCFRCDLARDEVTESNEAREALARIVGQHEPDVTSFDAGDLWGCGCGWEVVRDGTEWEQYAAHQADAILAAGWTLPTVKPSVEQVVDALAAQRPGSAEWTSSRIMQTARAVLALYPGRTETEVKAEALREAAQEWGDSTWSDVWNADRVDDDVSAVQSTVRWLNDRADQIEGGGA